MQIMKKQFSAQKAYLMLVITALAPAKSLKNKYTNAKSMF